eukprot:gb/GECG01008174.1/.p1 GENE.gb/GECG01008174.1/~~gb/GECG01008174.1/.p1  ORF type:complete len:126 (+),score=12.71 gb/GECG01008174.1/:1-378(+)
MAAPEAGTSGNVLFILTSHNKLGDTGKATGWYEQLSCQLCIRTCFATRYICSVVGARYLPEVAHAYRVLKGHGFAVTFATPLGGEAPMDPGSFDNFKDGRFINVYNINRRILQRFMSSLEFSRRV